MLKNADHLTLGIIVCKHCNCTIDTVDTEKVMIYYSDCNLEACIAKRTIKGENNNEC